MTARTRRRASPDTPTVAPNTPPFRPWTVTAMLAGVFLLKLIVLLQLRQHPLTQPDAGLDTTAYVELAQRVVAGDWGLGPGLYYVSPFYIYFLALGLAVFKSFTAVRLLQIALGTASVGFLFFTTRIWFGGRAAWFAAALAALTGLFTFYEVLILQASVDAFLTSAALYFLSRGLSPMPAGTTLTLLAAGSIFGLQTLNRPNVLIAAVAIAAVTLLVTRRVRPAALLAAGLLLGLAPAAARNLIVAHQWSLVSSHGGLNFYIGNREGATGFYMLVPGIKPTIGGQEKDVRNVAGRALGHPVDDAEASDYFFGLSRAWMTSHPGDAVWLFIRKLYFTFNAAHAPLPHSYPFYARDAGTALRFYVVGPWLLIPLGLVGLLLCAPSGRPAYLAWAAFVPAYGAAVAMFFVAERYRLPLLVPLCAGAGAVIDTTIRAAREQRWTQFVAVAATVAVAAAGANWPLRLNDGRWLEGLRTAQQYVIHADYAEADRWARRLDADAPPRPGAGSYGVGAQLLALNQTARALPYLETAHRLDPVDAQVDYALGQALLKSGTTAEAIPHLRRGFEAGIELPQGGYDLALALQTAGDFPAAAAVVRRINPSESDEAEAWMRLGRLASQARAPDAGERFFRQAARMRPDLAATRQQLGLNLLVLGRFDEAARELAEAARLDPRDPDTLSHLAYCELKLGQKAESRAHALAALALNPDDALARQLAAVR